MALHAGIPGPRAPARAKRSNADMDWAKSPVFKGREKGVVGAVDTPLGTVAMSRTALGDPALGTPVELTPHAQSGLPNSQIELKAYEHWSYKPGKNEEWNRDTQQNVVGKKAPKKPKGG